MNVYQKLAENLQYISPSFYKKRYFKKLIHLTEANFAERNVEPELIWVKNQLTTDSVFLDIGANVGTFIFHLENTIQPHNYFAFEPNAGLFHRLKRLFPKVKIYPFALSNENKKATFKVPIINGEKISSRGTLNTDFLEDGEQTQSTEIVEVSSLDSWLQKHPLNRIDLIKIDVEGHEINTLSGAKATLEKYQPVLMVEMEQRHHTTPVWQEIMKIESWGFIAHYLERTTFTLKPLSEEILAKNNASGVKDKKNYINNILFIPKNRS